MTKRRNRFLCKCGCEFKPTEDSVERIWETHGYKFEGYVYYIKCPRCKAKEKISLSKLPINVIFKVMKR